MEKPSMLPEPWYFTDQDLSQQLQIELHNDHILKGENTITVACRQDNDDVLFEMDNGKYSVVHLTWQNHPHKNTAFPITKIYSDWQSVIENRILPDAKEFY
ncbi:hypothetical protein [Chryseobacterium aquaeductus]|nr:hypothetical protein [Chryseobacterium aquaeductus]